MRGKYTKLPEDNAHRAPCGMHLFVADLPAAVSIKPPSVHPKLPRPLADIHFSQSLTAQPPFGLPPKLRALGTRTR